MRPSDEETGCTIFHLEYSNLITLVHFSGILSENYEITNQIIFSVLITNSYNYNYTLQ